jgi:hypothetical protein
MRAVRGWNQCRDDMLWPVRWCAVDGRTAPAAPAATTAAAASPVHLFTQKGAVLISAPPSQQPSVILHQSSACHGCVSCVCVATAHNQISLANLPQSVVLAVHQKPAKTRSCTPNTRGAVWARCRTDGGCGLWPSNSSFTILWPVIHAFFSRLPAQAQASPCNSSSRPLLPAPNTPRIPRLLLLPVSTRPCSASSLLSYLLGISRATNAPTCCGLHFGLLSFQPLV